MDFEVRPPAIGGGESRYRQQTKSRRLRRPLPHPTLAEYNFDLAVFAVNGLQDEGLKAINTFPKNILQVITGVNLDC